MPISVNLICSDEEQLEYSRGVLPHQFVGSIDYDCEECGFSVYMAVHREDWPRLNEELV
jgi:hypothetical protein